ncbi:hypothetical protein AB4520_17285 [Vibrio renipiscarius]|uniref:hypothetical protein n=1 Tax=Vibrio renipiscarius TaxID=1461322 RepID=UPI00354D3164
MSYNIHQCEYLPKSRVSIFSSDGRESVVWLLCITHEANEEELERNHKLECIGDIVWQTQVEIQCCPYCGERLVSDLKKMNASYHHYSDG